MTNYYKRFILSENLYFCTVVAYTIIYLVTVSALPTSAFPQVKQISVRISFSSKNIHHNITLVKRTRFQLFHRHTSFAGCCNHFKQCSVHFSSHFSCLNNGLSDSRSCSEHRWQSKPMSKMHFANSSSLIARMRSAFVIGFFPSRKHTA